MMVIVLRAINADDRAQAAAAVVVIP